MCLNLVYCLLVSFGLWAFLFVLVFCFISWVFEKLFQTFSDAAKQLEDCTEGGVALRRQQQKRRAFESLGFLVEFCHILSFLLNLIPIILG